MADTQRRDQALRDLERIREQPYEEFEDFHRWALAATDGPVAAATPERDV